MGRPLRTALFLCVCSAIPDASAQFLRLGPFDFAADTSLDAIYTTNVDEVRPSQSEGKEMTDYYLKWSFNLGSRADVAPSTELNLDTGLTLEKHFVRDDLDNSESPFGHARLDSSTTMGHYTFLGRAGYEKQYSEEEDLFIPGGSSKSAKDLRETREYGATVEWKRDPLSLSEAYDFKSERHADAEFESGDNDETTWNFDASLQLRRNLSLSYGNERKKTEFVNNPDANVGYLTTETFDINGQLQLIERPKVTYSIGVEKEDTADEEGTWDPTHTITATDEWDLSTTLHLSANANYTYEQHPEADDISFTYGLFLDHYLSPTAKQSLRFTREPVSTFGSTQDTDTTTYGYNFVKNDLFIYNLTLTFSVEYEISKPPEGAETEETLTYEASLGHSTAVSRKLRRELKYEYSLEDSNLIEENLEEHRVTLSYVYTF